MFSLRLARPAASSPTFRDPAYQYLISASRMKRRTLATTIAVPDIHDHAVLSVFDLFSIGVGPSSSHTVGPMRAARSFVLDLASTDLLPKVNKIKIHLYGSLAATGKGHMTPEAVLMGLEGEAPETVHAESIPSRYESILSHKLLKIGGKGGIGFDFKRDFNWTLSALPRHPNALTLSAFDVQGDLLGTNSYYSIGGGFVESDKMEYRQGLDVRQREEELGVEVLNAPRWRYTTASDLLKVCLDNDMSVHEVVKENERFSKSETEIRSGLSQLWSVMQDSINTGLRTEEKILPGGLNLRRRAPKLYKGWQAMQDLNAVTPTSQRRLLPDINLLSCFAIAVNETNASGGKVVTAPTNGAAGVIPAVLKYLLTTRLNETEHEELVEKFLLTSAAIGMLCKKRATISAAEGGCMAEIGVATAMAAAGLTACTGGTVKQVLMAAEIGLEHNLGLTCDPINGLVQVPCIERNSLGAIKSITAAQLALAGHDDPKICLDTIISAMKDTATNMHHHYKETSLGGLATAFKPLPIAPQC